MEVRPEELNEPSPLITITAVVLAPRTFKQDRPQNSELRSPSVTLESSEPAVPIERTGLATTGSRR